MPDDSRELTGHETTETMTLGDVIAQFQERPVGIIHGPRYTWVAGHSQTRGGVVLLDCYGDQIPGGYGPAAAPAQVVVR